MCCSKLLTVLHFKATNELIGIYVQKYDVILFILVICLLIADGYVLMPIRNIIENYL